MNKKNLLIIVIVFFSVFTSDVHATSCPSDSMAQLKNLASNVNYDYSYIELDDSVKFMVRFANVNPKTYIYDSINKISYYGNDNMNVEIPNLNPGYKYNFILKSSNMASSSNGKEVNMIDKNGNTYTHVYDFGYNNSECYNLDLLNQYIILPAYNKYYKDKLCVNLENFKLCQKWTLNNLEYNNFTAEIEKYKKNLEQNSKQENSNNKINLFEQFIKFYNEYYIYVYIMVGISIFSIWVINKRKNKRNNFNGW